MVKITSLCDNINNHKRLWSAEGNSLLIETKGLRLLYDAGRFAGVLEHNLHEMNLSLADIDYLILSHAHYGHCGALSGLQLPENTTVLYGPGFGTPKFKYKENAYQPVSNESLFSAYLRDNPGAICVKHAFELADGTITVYSVPKPSVHTDSRKHWIKERDSYRVDPFQEELNICIKTANGLIILTGCAHCGMENILNEAISITKTKTILALIGGTHIQDNPVRLDSFCDVVRRYNVNYIAPSHCTGFRSVSALLERFPDHSYEFNTGKTLTFDDEVCV